MAIHFDETPVHVPEGDLHELTWKLTLLIRTLLEADGRLSVAELAQRVDLHRDTTRRVCRTLTAAGWLTQHQAADGTLSYSLGSGLIQIAFNWFQRLEAATERLVALGQSARSPMGARRVLVAEPEAK